MGGVLCRAHGRIRGVALVAAVLLGVTGLAGASLPAVAEATTVLLSAAPDGNEGAGPYNASAPSIAAASWSSGGMPWSPARPGP